jgi:hypothetical protein
VALNTAPDADLQAPEGPLAGPAPAGARPAVGPGVRRTSSP